MKMESRAIRLIENDAILILILGGLFFFLYVFTFPLDFESPIVMSTNEKIQIIFSNDYKETGEPIHPVPFYNQLPQNVSIAFTPRDAAQVNGHIVPQTFLGVLIIFGTVLVFSKGTTFILTVIFSIFTALILYLLTKELFGRKIALAAYITVLFLSPFWYQSGVAIQSDMPALLFVMLGLYCGIKYFRYNKISFLILTSFFAGMATFLRLTSIIFVLPLAVLGYKYFKETRPNFKTKATTVIVLALIFALPIGSILLLNQQIYGSPFETGQEISREIIKNTVNVQSYLFSFSSQLVLQYFQLYVLSLPLFLISSIVILNFFRNGSLGKKAFSVYVICCFLFTLLYFGSHISWAFDKFAINAAFLRYLTPTIVLAVPLLLLFTKHINRKVLPLFVLVLVVSNFVTITEASSGIISTQEYFQYGKTLRDFVLKSTEPNAVICTGYDDKFLLGDRNILSRALLSENAEATFEEELSGGTVWDFAPGEEILAEKLSIVAKLDIPVYINNDKPNFDPEKLDSYLSKFGYYLKRVDSPQSIKLYKIVLKTPVTNMPV